MCIDDDDDDDTMLASDEAAEPITQLIRTRGRFGRQLGAAAKKLSPWVDRQLYSDRFYP